MQLDSRQKQYGQDTRWAIVGLLLTMNLLNYVDRYVLAAVESRIGSDLFPPGDRQRRSLDGLFADRVSNQLHDRRAAVRLAVGSGRPLVDHRRRNHRLEPGLGRIGPGDDLRHAAGHAAVHRRRRSGLWPRGPHDPGRFVSGRAARPHPLAVVRGHSGRQRAGLRAGRASGGAFQLAHRLLYFHAARHRARAVLPFLARSAAACHEAQFHRTGRGTRLEALQPAGADSLVRHQYAGDGGHDVCTGGLGLLDAPLRLQFPPRRFAAGRRIEPGAA